MLPDFFDCPPNLHLLSLLLAALALALAFECVNGFHDTANAVATVIYTRSLRPWVAVIYSGLLNFVGVVVSGVVVAYSIVNLFPVGILTGASSYHENLAMVLAVLLAALTWNLTTWYLGLPTSSSHTMVGAIMGVTLGYAVVHHIPISEGVQWHQAGAVATALLLSPVVGFVCAVVLMGVLKRLVKRPELYGEPVGEKSPPLWIRAVLVLTCGGVSLAHGSNDGQKGMGLVMVILILLCPASFALDLSAPSSPLDSTARLCQEAQERVHPGPVNLTADQARGVLEQFLLDHQRSNLVDAGLARALKDVGAALSGHRSLLAVPVGQRGGVRAEAILAARSLNSMGLESETARQLLAVTEYVLPWVKLAVALALGIGTAIGWKRIVVTIGERIGQNNLTYAQGVVAQSITMFTIMLADRCGMPVSTTHILSSGVAGSMVTAPGGLQRKTLVAICLCWIFTLPAAMSLACTLFFIFRKLGGI